MTSADPAGDWSDPVWMPDEPGIDSSFFFDDDGKAYVTANRVPPEGQQYPKHMEIWLQQYDLERRTMIGDKFSLWDGALKYAHAQEGPHIYKRDGYYYLLISEGGTGFTHAVTVARSERLNGPYEGCKANPILTHRNLGQSSGIVNVGHADLVETQAGEWWMVCLASRPYGGPYRNLGRETFLVPVAWEDGWPVVNPGKGIVEMESRRPALPEHRYPSLPACDHFDREVLDDRWNYIRTPRGEFLSLTERPGYLRLRLKPESIARAENPSFIGRRQQHMRFAARTVMEFAPAANGEAAGLVLLQNHDFQLRAEYGMVDGMTAIRLIERRDGIERFIAERACEAGKLYLKVEADGQLYRFDYAKQAEQWEILAADVDGRLLSSDVAGGFVGAYIGLYATSGGERSSADRYADFDWFEYKGEEV
ncbi:alpha-N-arabinofuranosidase [Paenibacillus harenae]|uniref:Alpha-N-arabinofuranosidase n=1 Tax=Paenibacillus harenae TaxID=306543 RepID=A0ABT9TV05_PAEHA|nr:alpha-N-arabinofuranosidase [Paenibacillus harenae]